MRFGVYEPSAERHDFAEIVYYRNHHAVVEHVVPVRAALFDKSRLFHFGFREPFAFEKVDYFLTAEARSETELRDEFVRNLPHTKVIAGAFASVGEKIVVIMFCCGTHKRIQPFAFFAGNSFVFEFFEFGNFHFRFGGEQTYGVDKVDAFHFLHERYGVSALFTTETMIKLFFFVYRERRFFFMMKRTAPPVGSALFVERNVARNKSHQIRSG